MLVGHGSGFKGVIASGIDYSPPGLWELGCFGVWWMLCRGCLPPSNCRVTSNLP